MKKMKKAILFVLAMLMLLPCTALAEEILTELDPFTGEESSGSSSGSTEETVTDSRIWVSTGISFDETRNMYCYDLGDVAPTTMYASVASGMVVTEPVSITIPGGVTATLYRNGTAVENPNYSRLEETGSYVLSLFGNSSMTVEPLTFTITDTLAGNLDFYAMPSGFSILSVKLDGVDTLFDPLQADFEAEGEYAVRYRCDMTGRKYELDLRIDHTPPVLELPEVVDGVAHGPVTISDLEEGASILIVQDGKEINYSETLTQSGVYAIAVTDEAGNTSTYSFTIMVYLNLSSYVFIALFVLVVAAVAAYLLISRKRLRVR